MTQNDWLILFATFLGWANGMWMGWVLWRKPEWAGLTDEDDLDWEEGGNLKDLVKAIETKLKEKNNV